MKRHSLKWIACFLCLLVFALIAVNLDNVTDLDSAVYSVFAPLVSPGMTGFALLCSQMVGPITLLVITILLVALLPKKEYRIPLLANLCIAVLLNLGLKQTFTRPRPANVPALVLEHGFSFPSGHTMTAACFYGFLIYLVWQLCTNKALRNSLTALLAAVIVLVGCSRIYLGVHYFTDVFAGLCVSVCYLIVFTSFVGRYFAQKEPFKPGTVAGHNRLFYSFSYAFQGIIEGLKTERNMLIHFGAMAMVVVFGVLLSISATEWCICIVLFGAVLMAEMLNTAIETVVDMVCPEVDPKAKLAKDTAAGAVLFMALAAATVGAIIFLPKIYTLVISQLLN